MPSDLSLKALKKLSVEEQEDAVRERLLQEAEIWAQYFIDNPYEIPRRWSSNFLTRPVMM